VAPAASPQMAVTGFLSSQNQEAAGQSTNFGQMALARLSDKASWLMPPDTAGTRVSASPRLSLATLPDYALVESRRRLTAPLARRQRQALPWRPACRTPGPSAEAAKPRSAYWQVGGSWGRPPCCGSSCWSRAPRHGPLTAPCAIRHAALHAGRCSTATLVPAM